MAKQIFEDFPEVDCNGCTHYYNETCDGTLQGSVRLCKEFKATRRVDIPLQINEAHRRLQRLEVLVGLCITGVAIVALMLVLLSLS